MGPREDTKEWQQATTVGALLVKDGACSEEHLRRALAYQKDTPGVPLGLCFVAIGAVSSLVVGAALAQQHALRHPTIEAAMRLALELQVSTHVMLEFVASATEAARKALSAGRDASHDGGSSGGGEPEAQSST